MKRRKTGKFLGSTRQNQEDINPMDGVANLADVMLVLACGIMLALITYWNVDVSGVTGSISVEPGQEITEDIAGFGQDKDKDNPDSSDIQYEEYGTVYRDPATGKLYMVTDSE